MLTDAAAFTNGSGRSGNQLKPPSERPVGRSIRPGQSVLHDARPSTRLQPSAWYRHRELKWEFCHIVQGDFRRVRDNTITGAVGVFYGGWRSFEDRGEFWRQSAFVNFVQTNMVKYRIRPDEREWQTGEEPFHAYLSELKPDFVLALGKELWNHLPERHLVKKIAVEGVKGDINTTRPMKQPDMPLIHWHPDSPSNPARRRAVISRLDLHATIHMDRAFAVLVVAEWLYRKW
jgi:hypothetical protein